ncbi:hypothetical protein [Lactiplantibacillus plantarum]|uniref:hypothetical protein n=1 Tax=Lactiplantibacillus plantarum TaxID=1590 RepID=UPI0040458223
MRASLGRAVALEPQQQPQGLAGHRRLVGIGLHGLQLRGHFADVAAGAQLRQVGLVGLEQQAGEIGQHRPRLRRRLVGWRPRRTEVSGPIQGIGLLCHRNVISSFSYL